MGAHCQPEASHYQQLVRAQGRQVRPPLCSAVQCLRSMARKTGTAQYAQLAPSSAATSTPRLSWQPSEVKRRASKTAHALLSIALAGSSRKAALQPPAHTPLPALS